MDKHIHWLLNPKVNLSTYLKHLKYQGDWLEKREKHL